MINLMQGDCLERNERNTRSVDMVLTDPPLWHNGL